MADLLQWLNLLLVPVVGLLIAIKADIADLKATQRHHAARLARLDGIEA